LISKIAAGKGYLIDGLSEKVVGCHYSIKSWRWQESTEAVKVIGDSLHSYDLLRENKTVLNKRSWLLPKGNTITTKGINEELDELRAIINFWPRGLEGIENRNRWLEFRPCFLQQCF
jgi:DNA mismatch repair protein MutS